MQRTDGRKKNELRKIKITRNYTKYANGSVLIEFGDTKVLCTAFAEEKVPSFLKNKGVGWVSAEYNMLPSATQTRKQRDIGRLKLDGRSAEIQRIIGRSLRSCVDMNLLGERTIWIDCDVLQADGGTRVTSICGAFVALYDALEGLVKENIIEKNPIKFFLAAVSVGIIEDDLLTDLCYAEDSNAIADINVVMNEFGEFIELQATSEMRPIRASEMNELVKMAENAINEIIHMQKEVLGVN